MTALNSASKGIKGAKHVDPIAVSKVFWVRRVNTDAGFKIQVTCRCDKCSAKRTITTRHNLPPEAMAGFFQAKHWQVDAKGKSAICPDCRGVGRRKGLSPQEHRKGNGTMPKKTAEIHELKADKPAEERVRQSQRSIRANIKAVRLLDEHFDADKGRYDDEWADARIAAETGLAEDFIAQMRKVEYGEIKPPDELLKLRGDFDALAPMVAEQIKEIQGLISEFRARIATVERKF